jgi:hypothetical protein
MNTDPQPWVGYHLIPLYRLIGPTAVIIILVMFILGMVRMLDILVRAIVIVRVHGCRFWMFGALWDTAYQDTVSPICWAAEKGREGAVQIENQMEAHAAYARAPHDTGATDNLDVAKSWRHKVKGMKSLSDASALRAGGSPGEDRESGAFCSRGRFRLPH